MIWPLSWGAMTARPSSRVLSLSKPKKDFSKHQRRSVIGGHPTLVKFGYPSERLQKLSEPKKCHPAFLQHRARESPEWPVSLAALTCNASPRIIELARPKLLHRDFMLPREVSKAAQKAIASPRTIELARPKKVHSDYAPPRDPEWPVSEAAKHAVATPRTVELAQPGKRPPVGLTLFNLDAFRVKETAMKATCSDRIRELARPIQH